MRLRTALVPVAVVLTACAPEPGGPAAPIAQAQVEAGPALEAGAARQAVIDFVEAYRASPTDGIEPLAGLVASEDLAAWVHWLGVQHREFPGTIDAASDVRDVEFIQTISTRQVTEAQVGLSASVTFQLDPDDGDPFELVRVLDGPVTLARTDVGTYQLLDLLRNGVPMTDGIEIFRNEVVSGGGLLVRLDSMFMFPPNWQFNVAVHNAGDTPVELDPAGATLFVDDGTGFQRVDGIYTRSLAVIPPGDSIESLMVFPAQESAIGRVLSLVYLRGRDRMAFEFTLEDLVTAVPPPPPAEEPVIEPAS